MTKKSENINAGTNVPWWIYFPLCSILSSIVDFIRMTSHMTIPHNKTLLVDMAAETVAVISNREMA